MEVLGDLEKVVQESLITDESDEYFPGEKQKELALVSVHVWEVSP